MSAERPREPFALGRRFGARVFDARATLVRRLPITAALVVVAIHGFRRLAQLVGLVGADLRRALRTEPDRTRLIVRERSVAARAPDPRHRPIDVDANPTPRPRK